MSFIDLTKLRHPSGRRSTLGLLVVLTALIGAIVVSAPGVSLAAAAELRGTITQSAGQPVAGATVEVVVANSTNVVATTTSNASGIYSLTVDEGTYDLRYTGPSSGNLGQATLPGRAITSPSTEINVTLVPSMVTVSGRAVLDPTRTFSYGYVQLTSATNLMNNFNTPINADGTFSLSVQAGNYYTTVNMNFPLDGTTNPMGGTNLSYVHNTRTFAADTVLNNIVFNLTEHDITVLNANGTPATNLDGNISESVSPYSFLSGTPATELYGFGWNGPLDGTTTIPAITNPTSTLDLNIRPRNQYTTLTTAILDITNTNSTVILLTGSGGVVLTGDDDGDNVSDSIEALAPNTDVNNDLIPDFEQDNVTSLPILGGQTGTYISLAVNNTLKLANVSTVPLPLDAPTTATFPFGLIKFDIPSVPQGEDTVVRIYVASAAGLTGYSKYNPLTSVWTQLPADRVVVDTVENWVEIRITDNGIGDDDPVLGRISDPGAPSIGSIGSTPPTITCPSIPTFIAGQPNATLTATVTDAESGETIETIVTAVSTSTVGSNNATVTASDTAGNPVTKTCPYKVTYRFSGFQQPIDSNALNSAKAGRTVPVKWRLTDWNGSPVSDPASFVLLASRPNECTNNVESDEVPTTTNGSGLRYTGDGNWHYNWKTTGLPTGCRELRLWIQGAPSAATAAFELR